MDTARLPIVFTQNECTDLVRRFVPFWNAWATYITYGGVAPMTPPGTQLCVVAVDVYRRLEGADPPKAG